MNDKLSIKKSKLKIILAPIVLFISPFAVILIAGIIYVSIVMISGNTLEQGIDNFTVLIQNLRPYFKYLTFIPMALIITAFLAVKIRKHSKNTKE